MNKLFFILPVSGILLLSCENQGVEDHSAEINSPETAQELDGEKLMKQRCDICHNPENSDNRLAPPMFRVKDHYIDSETSREEFITAVWEWVQEPTEEKSLMPGARRNFGIMPKQDFDEAEVKAIAAYLFDHDSE